MKYKYFLVWGLLVTLFAIVSGFLFSDKTTNSVVATSQCFQTLNSHEVSCGCEEVPGSGSVVVADFSTASGTGQRSFQTTLLTCNVGESSCQNLGYVPFTDTFCSPPPPSPSPTPTPGGGGECNPDLICPVHYYMEENCICQCFYSPIVIDVLGDGFDLTNAVGGVPFDLNLDGTAEILSWTSANSDDSWLALDRNSNGVIDNGEELFGNFSPQPEPPPGEERNGFLALAEFDKPSNGGNSDGVISRFDAIYQSLRLWRDSNHNGFSEPTELMAVNDVGLRKIHLDYRASRRTDEHGNRFKYRAKVKDARNAQLGRWAWDVFLVTQP